MNPIHNIPTDKHMAIDKNIEKHIRSRIAPCGLHCGGCFAFAEGEIHRLARELRMRLGDFDIYARRFVTLLDEPRFEKYGDFKIFLDYLAEASCKGCREESCKFFAGCRVRRCSERRGVEWCFQCDRFPCHATGFDAHLEQRSVAINERIRDIGPEGYYEEIKDLPRY